MKQIIIAFSLVIEIFLLLFLIPRVESGDLVFYKNLFNIYEYSGISDFINLDTAEIIGSRDYGFNLLLFIFSKIINFEQIIFLISLLYFISVLKLLIRKKLHYLILLLPFTLYTVGIQFSAIRLEIAIAIFILFYYSNIKFLKFLSVFFHTQIIPIFVSLLNAKINYKYFILASVSLAGLLFYIPHIIDKIIFYTQENSNIEKNYLREYGLLVYSIIIVSLSGNKVNYRYILKTIIFIPLIYFIGAGRLNIIIFYLMILNINEEKSKNYYFIFFIFIFFIYDVFKGLAFISGLISGNSGFENIYNIF